MRLLKRIPFVAAMSVLLAACHGDAGMRVEQVQADILLPLDSNTVEAVVPQNATLETLLRQNDVPADLTASLVQAVREVFNPRQLRARQPYRIVTSLDGLLREFRYEIDADKFLRVISRQLPGPASPAPAFAAEVVAYPKDVVIDAAGARISRDQPSLIAAMEAEGEQVYLALKLAEAFSGLVDFNSELQDGDEFRVLFDRVYRNGEPSGYDSLRAAVLHHEGKTIAAIPFEVDGKAGWYDGEGRSLKRQFLKSPLKFETTMSSGYNLRRLHPVYGSVRAHPAIDYRAGYGAPVVAIAAGEVVFAAFSGASGRLVTIRHPGGYESNYLHLSAFKVKRGDRVEQGEVIGNVGNSGVVTGTHLDFRMKRNGRWVNPLEVFRSLPAGDPIPASQMAAFRAERDRLFAELDARLAAPKPSRPDNN